MPFVSNRLTVIFMSIQGKYTNSKLTINRGGL